MPIRPATRADIPQAAKILAAAFGPDPLFKVIFPHQKQHPDAFVRAMEEHLWLAWWDWSKILMVSYRIQGEGEEGEEIETRNDGASKDGTMVSTGRIEGRCDILTGIAEWERIGTGWQSLHNTCTYDPRRLLKPALSSYYSWRRYLFPNPASAQPTPNDPSPLTFHNFLPKMIPFMKSFFDHPDRQVHWSLENLAIHPHYQGQVYGRTLAEHGLSMARNDKEGDLPVCVIAAPDKEGFYMKCGFKELVGWASETVDEEGRDNPLRVNGVGGGAVLWTK
jgi:GNAT superfamily N-acetyltransferase